MHYNVGRTVAFLDHADAYDKLLQGHHWSAYKSEHANSREDILYDIAAAARQRGYDSVRIKHPLHPLHPPTASSTNAAATVHHTHTVTYHVRACAPASQVQYTHRLESYFVFELQDVRDPKGDYTFRHNVCPPPSVNLTGGWRGQQPCSCDNRRSIVNC